MLKLYINPQGDEFKKDCPYDEKVQVTKEGKFRAPLPSHLSRLYPRKEELVIRYLIEDNYSGFITKEGKIFSSQAQALEEAGRHIGMEPTKETCGTWIGRDTLHNEGMVYGVNIAAIVTKKITFTGEEIKEVKYEGINSRDTPLGPWGEKLNSFTHMANIRNTIGMHSHREKKIKEIPYTESNAEFFYTFIIKIIELGEKFRHFFDDEKALEHKISKNLELF